MEFKTADNATMMYEISGNGDTVVFLPGILGSTVTFAGVFPFLEERYRCVAVEYVAQTQTGLGGRKTVEEFAVKQHADDVERLLDHLQISECHLVGLSYGSVIAQELVKRRGNKVKSLTLLAALLNNQTFHYKNWIEHWYDCSFDLDRFTRAGLGLLFSETHLANLDDAFTNMRQFYAQFKEDNLIAFRFNLKNALNFPIHETFPLINCPLRLVHGAEDILHPIAEIRRFLEQHNSLDRLRVLDGVGHGLHAEAPEQVAKEIKAFLDQQV